MSENHIVGGDTINNLKLSQDNAKLLADNLSLCHRVSELEKEVAHWKNNHETEVRRARILKERTDMPIERVQAYEQWGKDMAERDELLLVEKNLTELHNATLVEWEAMKQQRDELERERNYLLLNADVAMKCIGEMGPSKPAVKAFSILQEAVGCVKEK